MTRKNDIPEIFKPFYNTEKSYIVKLDDNFTDEEYTLLNESIYDNIYCNSEIPLNEENTQLIRNWIYENKKIKIKGITWIRAFAKMIKQYGFKNIDKINNVFAGILKQRAILLNGDALKMYVTRPGDSKDPYHRNPNDSDSWGNGGSCWFKHSYSYRFTYSELIEAGELYAIIITNPARNLVYRFWSMRDESAPDAIAVFNCYRNGERSDGWEDYKILASNLNSPVLFRARFNSSGLYINNDIGYILTHHTLLKNQDRINTCYDISEEREDESNIGTCYECENTIGEDDNYQEINGRLYCENCFSYCNDCGEYYVGEHTHECPECGESFNPNEYDECPHCAELRHCPECNEDYYISDGHLHVCECGKRFDIGDIDDCPYIHCPECRRITRENQLKLIPDPAYNSTLTESPAGLIPGKYYRWDGPPTMGDDNSLVSDMKQYMTGESFKCIECSPARNGFGIRFARGSFYTWDKNNFPHFIESESIPENEVN